jgi:hypothetical protein
VRASQYDGPLSDGSGSSGGSALALSVPSGCIQRMTLPAFGPVAVCRYVRPRSNSYDAARLLAAPVCRQCRRYTTAAREMSSALKAPWPYVSVAGS